MIGICILVTHRPPGRQQGPNPALLLDAEHGNPVSPPSRDSRLQSLPMAVRVWEVGRSEGRGVMPRIRV